MTRIRLSVRPHFVGARLDPSAPFASAFLLAPKHRAYHKSLEALVDTGSPFTTLAPRDAERFQIPVDRLPPFTPSPKIRVAGYACPAHVMNEARLLFRDAKWRAAAFPVQMVVLGSPPKSLGIEAVPSIIGMDFLKQNRVALHHDPAKGESWLEAPDPPAA